MGRRAHAILSVAAAAWLAAACAHPVRAQEISRERAVEIARRHVTFKPSSVDASKATSTGRAIWRVTFRGRLPGQPPLLFETIIVELDRQSGEVISIARN